MSNKHANVLGFRYWKIMSIRDCLATNNATEIILDVLWSLLLGIDLSAIKLFEFLGISWEI